jgi:hypothetical protein
MELGEDVNPAMVADEKHDSSCYFCNAKDDPKNETNELVDEADEDSDLDGSMLEGAFKNNAAKLGTAIGGNQGKRPITLAGTKGGKKLEVSVAAHHLIPGNAALKNSELFKSEEYLWKDGNAKGNICYNVNAAPNGEWLPGNYAARPWGTAGVDFTKAYGPTPQAYAFAAIEAWGRQFHDAHEVYSTFVKDALDKIYDKLDAGDEVWCPEAKKKEKDPTKREPLYVLVSRLNTVSSRMRQMLVVPSSNWKKNIYTSAFSLTYMTLKPVHLTSVVT